MPHVAWPLFDVRVETPLLSLRSADDQQLMSLADRAAGRLLEASQSAFMDAWMRLDSPHFQREFMRKQWLNRATWRPCRWILDFCIFPNDSDFPMGRIEVTAEEFCSIRSVSSVSWLLPEARGQGLGLEARSALLHFLFDGLGAVEARADAHPENLASLKIAERLGYLEDGSETVIGGNGLPYRSTRMVLSRERWLAERRDDITVFNLDAALCMFGLALQDGHEVPVSVLPHASSGGAAGVPGWSLFDSKAASDFDSPDRVDLSDLPVPVPTPVHGPAL